MYIIYLFYKQDNSELAFMPLIFNLIELRPGLTKHLYSLIDGIPRLNWR